MPAELSLEEERAQGWGVTWGLREGKGGGGGASPPRGLQTFIGLKEGAIAGAPDVRRARAAGGGRAAAPPPPPPSLRAALLACGATRAAASTQGTHQRLSSLLSTQGRFPAKFRQAAWGFLLRLPGNEVPAAVLAARGPHPAWEDLGARFPVRPRRDLQHLSQCVSALAHWSPVLGGLPVLPLFVFPFVKCFGAWGGGADSGEVPAPVPQLLPTPLLEQLLTLLLTYAAPWVQCLPSPPIALLATGHALLAHWDPTLAAALSTCGADPTRTLWPLLRSALSEVLPRGDWEAAWDGILCDSHDPSILLFTCIAFLRLHRQQLMALAGGCRRAVAQHPGGVAGEGAGGAHGPFGGGLPAPPAAQLPPQLQQQQRQAPLPGFSAPPAPPSPQLATLAAFLRTHAPTSIPSLLRLARHMAAHSPAQLRGGAGAAAGQPFCGPPEPLPAGYYPAFLAVPTYLVDAAAAERAQIAAAVALREAEEAAGREAAAAAAAAEIGGALREAVAAAGVAFAEAAAGAAVEVGEAAEVGGGGAQGSGEAAPAVVAQELQRTPSRPPAHREEAASAAGPVAGGSSSISVRDRVRMFGGGR